MGVRMRTIAARTPRNSMKRARALRERIRTHLSDLNNLKHQRLWSAKGSWRPIAGGITHRRRARLIRRRAVCHYPLRQKRLYEGTGFPQAGQGKRGENNGESKSLINIFVFYNFQCFRPGRWVLVVWSRPKNVSSVPSHFGTISCQMVQVRRGWTFRPGSSI